VKLSIETVILLVVTIAIVGAVAAWAMGYIGGSMTGTPDFTPQIDQCLVSKTYLKIKNLATTDIVGVAVKVGDTSCTVTYVDGSAVSSSKPIKSGDMVQLVVTGYTANVGDRITFTIQCTFADGKLVAKDVQAIVKSF
jgi:hypothetical protein